jgi:outer membrane protein assembly factor BamB
MRRPTTSELLLRGALCLALLMPHPLAASEFVVLNAGSDSYLRANAVNTNSGAQASVEVRSQAGNNRRGVIFFDVAAGVPAGAAIKTSVLGLFINGTDGARTHNVHRIVNDPMWTETGVTWNRRTATPINWATPGGDFFATPIASQNTTGAGTVLNWTILGDAGAANIPQGWYDGSVPNRGLLIKDATESNAVRRRVTYSSKENGTVANRPRLTVHYLRNVALAAPVPGISEVTWSWTFPPLSTAANYDGVLFAKRAGGAFVFSPADSTAYAVGLDLGNGESVAINTSLFTDLSGVDENGAESVVLPGTTYDYRAFNHDSNIIFGAAATLPPHYAPGTNGSATTLTGGGLAKNWSYRTGATTLAPPSLDPGNFVVTGSNDNKVHTMDAGNGGRRYRPAGAIGTTGGAVQSRSTIIPAAFTAVDCDLVTPLQQPCDVIYAGAADGRVYAFRADTGVQLWQSAVLGSSIQGSAGVQLKNFSDLAYPHAFDLVIVGTRNTADSLNNSIVALNGQTGAVVWTFQPGNLDIISSAPALEAGNSVWVTSRAGLGGTQPSLWRLDTATTNPAGNLLASVSLSSLPAANRDVDGSPTPTFDGQFVYALTTGGDLVAVEAANPGNVYTTNVGAFAGVDFPIPIPAGNTDEVYFSTTGGVHKRIFDRGAQTFSVGWDTAAVPNPSTPIFTPEPLALVLYVGGSDGRLHKIDPANGGVLGTRDVNLAATIGAPSFDTVSLKIYVGDSSGRIYSFDQF